MFNIINEWQFVIDVNETIDQIHNYLNTSPNESFDTFPDIINLS